MKVVIQAGGTQYYIKAPWSHSILGYLEKIKTLVNSSLKIFYDWVHGYVVRGKP